MTALALFSALLVLEIADSMLYRSPDDVPLSISVEPYELSDHLGGAFTNIDFITTSGIHGTLAGASNTVIYSRHHSPTVGTVVHFGDHWGVVDRVVTGALDCVVAYLDRDIPIEPVLLAPANWTDYLEPEGTPCVYITKYKEVVESSLISTTKFVNLHSFSVGSNSPLFRVVDGVPVMVGHIVAFPNHYVSAKWYDIDAPRGWYKADIERVNLTPTRKEGDNEQ